MKQYEYATFKTTIDINTIDIKVKDFETFATLRIQNDDDDISITMFFESVNEIEQFSNLLDTQLSKHEIKKIKGE